MITFTRDDLMAKVVHLSHLYPEMRLGQLFAFLGSLAGKNVPGMCSDFDDSTLLQVAEEHIRRRTTALLIDTNADVSSLPSERQQAIRALAAYHEAKPMSLGRLVHEAAVALNTTEYDLEDKEMAQAIKKLKSPENLRQN